MTDQRLISPPAEQHSDSDRITEAALQEKAKLKKHFGRFDIFFFLICAIVGVDTLGQVAANGPQGFVWLVFLGIFFFIPYGLLVAELGSTFSGEGGPYLWSRLAWGRLPAGINSIFFWSSTPVWVGATLTFLTIAAVQEYFFSFGDNSFWWWTIGLGFIWFSVWSAILSFGIGKWIPTIGAWCRIILVFIFLVTTITYGVQYGLNTPAAGEWSPTWASFIALVPLLFFNLVGFEQPSAAGDEMKDPQRDVPLSVLRAMVASILLYGLPILAIVFVLPAEDLEGRGVSSFLDAVDTTFRVWGPAQDTMTHVAVVMFALTVVSSASAWLMGGDRAQAVASVDGTGPRWLGYISERFGTPIAVNLVSGVISTAVLAAAALIGSGDAATAFNVCIGIVLSFTTLSYVAIFPTIIKLRYSHPDVYRPYSVPGGLVGAWVVGGLCTFWAVFATLVGVFPGLLSGGTFLDDSALPEDTSRLGYTALALGAIVIAALVGMWFYWLGRKTRATLVAEPVPEVLDQRV